MRRVLEAHRDAVRQEPQVAQGHGKQCEHGADRRKRFAPVCGFYRARSFLRRHPEGPDDQEDVATMIQPEKMLAN